MHQKVGKAGLGFSWDSQFRYLHTHQIAKQSLMVESMQKMRQMVEGFKTFESISSDVLGLADFDYSDCFHSCKVQPSFKNC